MEGLLLASFPFWPSPLDFLISLTGLVDFVLTNWLSSVCTGENGATSAKILTKPVNTALFLCSLPLPSKLKFTRSYYFLPRCCSQHQHQRNSEAPSFLLQQPPADIIALTNKGQEKTALPTKIGAAIIWNLLKLCCYSMKFCSVSCHDDDKIIVSLLTVTSLEQE